MRIERVEEKADVLGTVIDEVEDCGEFVNCCEVVLGDGESSRVLPMYWMFKGYKSLYK